MPHNFAAASGQLWSIIPDHLAAVAALLGTLAPDAPPSFPRTNGVRPLGTWPTVADGLARIPVTGVLMPDADSIGALPGCLPITDVLAAVRMAIANTAVRGVVLAFHSPGGPIAGVSDAVAELAVLGRTKPIVSYAPLMLGGTAYWLAAVTSRIGAGREAEIGPIAALSQITAAPLGAPAALSYRAGPAPKASAQIAKSIAKSVARCRGASWRDLLRDSERTWPAASARSRGFVDFVGTADTRNGDTHADRDS